MTTQHLKPYRIEETYGTGMGERPEFVVFDTAALGKPTGQPREVARTENFESGSTACIKCGKTLRLNFNGGELDSVVCCGLEYRTEVQRTDLVVFEVQVTDTTNAKTPG